MIRVLSAVAAAFLFYGSFRVSAAAAQSDAPSSCPTTRPAYPAFVPPGPYPAELPTQMFWYGTINLWTRLRVDGTWRGVPPWEGYKRGYRDKLFWWRPGYDGRTEPRPALTLTGRRLDGPPMAFRADPATNGTAPDLGGSTMLVAPDIPTAGCWELTATYRSERVTFVVWVVP